MTFRVLNPIFSLPGSTFGGRRRRYGYRAPLVAVILGWACIASAQFGEPIIIDQPQSGTAAIGEEWGFSVTVDGFEPFTYIWEFNGNPIADEDSSTLLIPDVQQNFAGVYSVVIINSEGQVTSEDATLTVSGTPPRNLRNGDLTTAGGRTTLPIVFSGNGREQSLSFSLKYDTNVFSNPSWTNRLTNAVSTLDFSLLDNGHIGLTVSLPEQYPAATQLVGEFVFDLALAADPFSASLQFTNIPTSLEAINTNGTSIQMQSNVVPQLDRVDAAPILNNQSGLMEQRLTLSYAGEQSRTNVYISVADLGVDALTNAVTLYNAVGTNTVDISGYGDEFELPYVDAGVVTNGTSRTLTMEYYVPDRVTSPIPVYYVNLGEEVPFAVPTAVTPLNVSISRFQSGTYIIQFDSLAGYIYYVQYAASVTDLNNFGPTSRVVQPPVLGTGFSMQWIDNGPPKTESDPSEGMRFYRLLELPAN